MPAANLLRTRRAAPLAAIAAIAALALAGCGGGGSKSSASTTAKRAPAVAASVADLKNVQSSLGHPIYWVGSKSSFTYELTKTNDGNVYVRYLPSGVKVGDSRPEFLTVGTYPQTNAFQNIQTAAKRKGAHETKLSGGGLAVENSARPTSVYVAYPNSSVLVEVFDPSAKVARSIVRAGQVRPLG
jgi:hypothetical protein